MSEIISRAEAKARGLTRYFTGKPCKNGHVTERHVNGGSCIKCLAVTAAAYAAADPEKERARHTAYQAAHREQRRAWQAAWAAAHPEKVRAMAAAYRAAHPEKVRASYAAYRVTHPEKVRAITAKRRAMKFVQRCTCCTDAQIELLYLAAKPWGAHAEVDHRIQLALGGKHCTKNLVLLPAAAHAEKTKTDARLRAEARRRSRLLRGWGVQP